MTVRRLFPVVAALIAVFLGAGCSDRNREPLPAETDEPFYVQGKQLMKQGRNPEALTAFLKVIDHRGERGAPESHLEAGSIYLYHTKDPVEAYHHFRKYLDLQPNSKEAQGVRGKVEEAKREFARTLPARPLDDQSMKLQAEETVARLRRENEELRAQIQTLRGGAAMPVSRATPMISLPEESPPRSATPPVTPAVDSPLASAPLVRTPPAQTPAGVPPTLRPPAGQPRPTTPTRPDAATGRTHTVKPKETLYMISKQYNVKLEDLAAANGIRDPSKVPIGTVLKIPGAAGAR